MPNKYIWIQNTRYYHYKTYGNEQTIHEQAKKIKKKYKAKYFILTTEKQSIITLLPITEHHLYTNKPI